MAYIEIFEGRKRRRLQRSDRLFRSLCQLLGCALGFGAALAGKVAVAAEGLGFGAGLWFGLGEGVGDGFGGAFDFGTALTWEMAVAAESLCPAVSKCGLFARDGREGECTGISLCVRRRNRVSLCDGFGECIGGALGLGAALAGKMAVAEERLCVWTCIWLGSSKSLSGSVGGTLQLRAALARKMAVAAEGECIRASLGISDGGSVDRSSGQDGGVDDGGELHVGGYAVDAFCLMCVRETVDLKSYLRGL